MYINDYELIYYYKENNSEKALTILIKKYCAISIKIGKTFHITYDFSSYLQEALMLVYKCINFYDDSKGIPFYRYYVYCLKRLIFRYLANQKKLSYEVLVDEIDTKDTKNEVLLEEAKLIYSRCNYTDFEKKVFNEILVSQKKVKVFVEENKVSKSKVYYTINKIREKLRTSENKS